MDISSTEKNSQVRNPSSPQAGTTAADINRNSTAQQSSSPAEDAVMKSNQGHFDASRSPFIEQSGPTQEDAAKHSGQLTCVDNGTPARKLKRKNTSRPSVGSSRVLRVRSQEKNKPSETSNSAPEGGSNQENRKKKKKKTEKNPVNEFSRIRTHLKYLMNRMKYEQSLIEAYSGEGWKGLSLEKLKPEKELHRARSEILRCKLKIRDLFQRLDSSCAEGKLPESLFDSEGQIDSEDIFCAKCGLEELTLDNDIILCDGACERGFHQFCLDPPLLKEDIPPDDEGWLCPSCDCKVDCIDTLNDSQGTNLSITDSWEKVFPEAATAAAGNNLDDMPSDDSEDDDYNPDGPKMDEKTENSESGSDDSEYYSASDDLDILPNDKQNLSLPSDDSEDDNYDPDATNPDNQVMQESSSSDFTSDSEDFNVASDGNILPGQDKRSGDLNENQNLGYPDDDSDDDDDDNDYDPDAPDLDDQVKQESSSSDFTSDSEDVLASSDDLSKPSASSNGEKHKPGSKKRLSLSELSYLLESASEPVSQKRLVERLDYKKLHDEAYGNVSSDSSDEDFEDSATPKQIKSKSQKFSSASSSKKTPSVERDESDAKNKTTTKNKKTKKMKDENGEKNNSPAKLHEGSSGPESSAKRAGGSQRRLGEIATQRLYESFKENQYPSRDVKEKLATELGLKLRQISKWFENARWSYRHPPKMESPIAKPPKNKATPSPKPTKKPPEPEEKPVENSNSRNGLKNEETPKKSSANTVTGNKKTPDSKGNESRKRKLDSGNEESPTTGKQVRRSGRIQTNGKSVL